MDGRRWDWILCVHRNMGKAHCGCQLSRWTGDWNGSCVQGRGIISPRHHQYVASQNRPSSVKLGWLGGNSDGCVTEGVEHWSKSVAAACESTATTQIVRLHPFSYKQTYHCCVCHPHCCTQNVACSFRRASRIKVDAVMFCETAL